MDLGAECCAWPEQASAAPSCGVKHCPLCLESVNRAGKVEQGRSELWRCVGTQQSNGLSQALSSSVPEDVGGAFERELGALSPVTAQPLLPSGRIVSSGLCTPRSWGCRCKTQGAERVGCFVLDPAVCGAAEESSSPSASLAQQASLGWLQALGVIQSPSSKALKDLGGICSCSKHRLNTKVVKLQKGVQDSQGTSRQPGRR